MTPPGRLYLLRVCSTPPLLLLGLLLALPLEAQGLRGIGLTPSAAQPAHQQLPTPFTRGTLKPAAHLVGDPSTQDSLRWRANTDRAFLRHGFSLSNNSLLVPTSGLYFVYSQVVFSSALRSPCAQGHRGRGCAQCTRGLYSCSPGETSYPLTQMASPTCSSAPVVSSLEPSLLPQGSPVSRLDLNPSEKDTMSTKSMIRDVELAEEVLSEKAGGPQGSRSCLCLSLFSFLLVAGATTLFCLLFLSSFLLRVLFSSLK